MDAHGTLTVIDACSGYGGMELGLRLTGLPIRVVCRIERDAYAAAILAQHMESGALDPCPIWDNLETFDGSAWRQRVDLVTAGFPCQPWSAAGRRAGTDDDRWLWPRIAQIVADVGPRLVFLENVPGLNPRSGVGGLPYILEDLARLGFDAEWGLLGASDVGAPHLRKRFWLLALSTGSRKLAHANGDGRQGFRQWDGGRFTRDDADRPSSADVGHPAGPRHLGDAGGEPRGEGQHDVGATDSSDVAHGAVEDVGDAQGARHEGLVGPGEPPIAGPAGPGRGELADAPSVDEREPHDEASTVARRGDARVDAGGGSSELADASGIGGDEGLGPGPDECSSGWPDAAPRSRAWPPRPDDVDGWREWVDQGGPEPQLRRVTDGRTPGLADALHLGGNGLVPAVAAAAFAALATRAGWGSVILAAGDDPDSYTCPYCGRTSHHPDDIRERYCGACHRFAS